MKKIKSNTAFILILSALMAFTSLATDIYLPAMPIMQKQLEGSVQFTISGFLIGFAISQIIWGPISDRFGRKVPLYIGIVIFIIGSIGCALSQTIYEIVFFRVIQAIGACVGPMISRAMVRDSYDNARSAQVLSTLMVIMAIAPIIGPVIGGMIVKNFSWRLIFWFMAIIGATILVATLFLPETIKREPDIKSGSKFKHILLNYKVLLSSKQFMAYTLIVSFFYIGIYAFITGSSEVYIEYFNVKVQYYGFLFGINIVGVSILSAINRKLVTKYTLNQLLLGSTIIASIASLILLVSGNTKSLGWLGVALPMFIIFSMNGIVAACANAGALASVPNEMAGSAAALIGALQYGSGIISSILLGFFKSSNPFIMVLIITISMLCSCTISLFLGKSKKAVSSNI